MDVTLPSSLQSIIKNNISFGDVIISFPYDLYRDDSQNHIDLQVNKPCQLKFNLEFIGPFLFFTKSAIIDIANPLTLKLLTNNFPTFVIFIPNFIIKNSTRLSLNQNDSKNNFQVTLQPSVHLLSTMTAPLIQLPKNISCQKININSICYFINEFVITFNSSDHMNTFITSFSSFAFNYQVSIMNCPEKELCKIGNVNCLGSIINRSSTDSRRKDCIYINENFKVTKAKPCNLVLVHLMDIYSIQLHGVAATNINSNNDDHCNNGGKNEAIACLLDLPVGPSTTVLTFNQSQMDLPHSDPTKKENESISSTNNNKLSFFDQFESNFFDRFKKKPELSCIFALSDIEKGIEVVFCCEKPCEALGWVAVIHAWILRAKEAAKKIPISPLHSPSASPRRKSDYGTAHKQLKFEFSSSSDSYEFDESSEPKNLPQQPKKPTKFVQIQKARSNFQIAQKRVFLNNRLNNIRKANKKLLLNIKMNSYSDEEEDDEYYSDDDNSNDNKKLINSNKNCSNIADKNQDNNKKVLNNNNNTNKPSNVIRNTKSDFEIQNNNDNDNSKFIMDKIYNHYRAKNDKNNDNDNNDELLTKKADKVEDAKKDHRDNSQFIMDVLNNHYKAKNDKAKQIFQEDNQKLFINNQSQFKNKANQNQTQTQTQNKNDNSADKNKDNDSLIELEKQDIEKQTIDSTNNQNNAKKIRRKKRIKKRSSSLSNKLSDINQTANIPNQRKNQSNQQAISIKQTDSSNNQNESNQIPSKQIIKKQSSSPSTKLSDIRQTTNIPTQKTSSLNQQENSLQSTYSSNNQNEMNQIPNKQIIRKQSSSPSTKLSNAKQITNIPTQKTNLLNQQEDSKNTADSSNNQNESNQIPSKQIIKRQSSNPSTKLSEIRQTTNISTQKMNSLNHQEDSLQSADPSNNQNETNQIPSKQIIKRQSSSPAAKLNDIIQTSNISTQKINSLNHQEDSLQSADPSNNQNETNQIPNKQIIKRQSSSPAAKLNDIIQTTNNSTQKMDSLNHQEDSLQSADPSNNQNDKKPTRRKKRIKKRVPVSSSKLNDTNQTSATDISNQTSNSSNSESANSLNNANQMKQPAIISNQGIDFLNANSSQMTDSLIETNTQNQSVESLRNLDDTKQPPIVSKQKINSSFDQSISKAANEQKIENSTMESQLTDNRSAQKQTNENPNQLNDKQQTTNISKPNINIESANHKPILSAQTTESLHNQNNMKQTLNSSDANKNEKQTLSSSNKMNNFGLCANTTNQTTESFNKQNQIKNSLNEQNKIKQNEISSNTQKNETEMPNKKFIQSQTTTINNPLDKQSEIETSNSTDSSNESTEKMQKTDPSNHQFHDAKEPSIFDQDSKQHQQQQKDFNDGSTFKFELDGLDLSFHSFAIPDKNNNSSNNNKDQPEQQKSLDLLIPYLDSKSNGKDNEDDANENEEDDDLDDIATDDSLNEPLNDSNEASIEAALFEARNLINEIQSLSPTSKLKMTAKPIISNNFIHQNVVDLTIKTLVNEYTDNSNATTENDEKIDCNEEDKYDYTDSFQQCDERTTEEIISSSFQKFENAKFNISNFVKISDFHSFDFGKLLEETTMKRPIVEEYAFTIQQIVSLANNDHLSIVRRIGVSINEFISKYAKHGNKNNSITVTESSESLRLCFLISALFLNGLKGFNSFGLENEFLDALKALTIHINQLEEVYESVSSEKTILTQISKFVILLLNSQSLNFVLESILDHETWISEYYSSTSYFRDEETLKQIAICNSVIQYMNFDINENTNIIANVSHEDKLKFVFRPAYSFLEIDSIISCQDKNKMKNEVVEFLLKELILNSNGKGWQFLCLLAESNHVKINCEVKLFRESVLNAKKNAPSSENDEKRVRAVLLDGLKYGLLHIWFILMFTNQELTQQFFTKDSFFVDLYRANHILEAFAAVINDYLLIY